RRPRRPVAAVVRPRLLAACAFLTLAAFAVLCVSLTTGEYPLPVTEAVPALWGGGEPGARLIVWELRLPRALAGLLAGAAFGVSGAIFQTLTRNPLASPDMLGITQGAGVAVVGGIVLGLGAGLGTQTLGLAGALVTALLIYA